MRIFRSGVDSGEVPQWYWLRGLHDALVLAVDTQEFAYDVTQRKPVRNCMTIRLDARGALYDTSVTAIRLYNYKVLRDGAQTGGYGEGLSGCYWMQDRLRWEKGKFILDITALGKTTFSIPSASTLLRWNANEKSPAGISGGLLRILAPGDGNERSLENISLLDRAG